MDKEGPKDFFISYTHHDQRWAEWIAFQLEETGSRTIIYQQGQYAQAEPLFQRALHIREQALGPDHPNMAYPLNNLANLYYQQGKHAQAEDGIPIIV